MHSQRGRARFCASLQRFGRPARCQADASPRSPGRPASRHCGGSHGSLCSVPVPVRAPSCASTVQPSPRGRSPRVPTASAPRPRDGVPRGVCRRFSTGCHRRWNGYDRIAERSPAAIRPVASAPTSRPCRSLCTGSSSGTSYCNIPPLRRESRCCIHRLNPQPQAVTGPWLSTFYKAALRGPGGAPPVPIN